MDQAQALHEGSPGAAIGERELGTRLGMIDDIARLHRASVPARVGYSRSTRTPPIVTLRRVVWRPRARAAASAWSGAVPANPTAERPSPLASATGAKCIRPSPRSRWSDPPDPGAALSPSTSAHRAAMRGGSSAWRVTLTIFRVTSARTRRGHSGPPHRQDAGG